MLGKTNTLDHQSHYPGEVAAGAWLRGHFLAVPISGFEVISVFFPNNIFVK